MTAMRKKRKTTNNIFWRVKMIITFKELFDEYTKAEMKTGFIHNKAKELNVPRSSIIAELLKSGYKLDEIRHSDANNYKAGLNKYNKWIESGKPETTFEVPEPAAVIKKPYVKPVLEIIEAPEEEVKKLIPTEAHKKIETEELAKHPVDKELKRAVLENTSAKQKEAMSEQDIAKLKYRIVELENENRKAADKIREFSEYKQKYEELLDQYDIATLDNETAQNGLCEEYKKQVEVEKKLRKAERIICDRLYEDMPDEAE